jgi:hypothetical protein
MMLNKIRKLFLLLRNFDISPRLLDLQSVVLIGLYFRLEDSSSCQNKCQNGRTRLKLSTK